MYIAAEPTESLVQGDVCADIPLPLVLDGSRLLDVKAEKLLEAGVPTETMLLTKSKLALLVPMVRGHVLVLSQSCDLAEAEKNPNARILVAPTFADDYDRFEAAYAATTKASAEALTKKMLTAVRSNNSVDSAFASGKDSLEKGRHTALEQLWLGKIVGAFPLASHQGTRLQRSICFFDNAVTLPASWLPLLKKQRVLRLDPNWADVLREQLSTWISRFAFPGDKNARLAVGGLVDEPNVESDSVSATSVQGGSS